METLQRILENTQQKIVSNFNENENKNPKWKEFCRIVKNDCTQTAYENWISPIQVNENESQIEIIVPNIFVKEYILSKYEAEMNRIFPKKSNGQIAVTFTISTLRNENHLMLRTPNIEYFESKIGKKYQKAFLEFCDPKIINQNAIEWGYQWAKNPSSLFIHGGVGSGKTHFCIAIIRQAFKEMKIFQAEFFVGTSLDSEGLEAIKSDSGDRQFLKKFKEVEFLFIDDFGRETRSERLSRQYFDIINHRYSNEMPTIISSNLNLKEVANRSEEAIASRMQEWKLIEMTGKDARILR